MGVERLTCSLGHIHDYELPTDDDAIRGGILPCATPLCGRNVAWKIRTRPGIKLANQPRLTVPKVRDANSGDVQSGDVG